MMQPTSWLVMRMAHLCFGTLPEGRQQQCAISMLSPSWLLHHMAEVSILVTGSCGHMKACIDTAVAQGLNFTVEEKLQHMA